jgi:hypothetical protein
MIFDSVEHICGMIGLVWYLCIRSKLSSQTDTSPALTTGHSALATIIVSTAFTVQARSPEKS